MTKRTTKTKGEEEHFRSGYDVGYQHGRNAVKESLLEGLLQLIKDHVYVEESE